MHLYHHRWRTYVFSPDSHHLAWWMRESSPQPADLYSVVIDPTNPTNPMDPTNPTNPTNPTIPTTSTNPSNPTNPTTLLNHQTE
jgi:hypothetical protein